MRIFESSRPDRSAIRYGPSVRVVIIGAGPAGLASAACLARHGVATTLLERGGVVAAALRTVDPAMALFSPARLSRLPEMDFATSSTYPTFHELVTALEHYRDQHAIAPVACDVTAVERQASGFLVRGRDASGRALEIEGSHVIDATGILSAPRLPADFDRAATKLRWMHSLDVRRAHVEAARRLLVVGAGASAAEVLEHWLAVRTPGDRAWIGVRSKIRAMPQSVLGIDLHYLLWLPEHLPGRPLGPLLAGADPMWGSTVPRAIRRREIEQVAIARYAPSSVELASGETIEPDLVVFATGFHHARPHLGSLVDDDREGWPIARRCESRRTPELFLVGARYARSLASPTLRGIARDAAYVARRIAG